MTISRRGALLGATAAVAVVGVPTAVTAHADPVAVLVNKALIYLDWLNAIPSGMPEEEFNTHCDVLWAMYDQIRDTPATSVEGAAGKVRIAYLQADQSIDAERIGPPDDFTLVGSLESSRFIWSALQDFKRLAGEARP